MKELLIQLKSDKEVDFPDYIVDNLVRMVIAGSQSYGCSTENSDIDCIGICVPPKEVVFPHLAGKIKGFDDKEKTFNSWSKQHIMHNNKEYDFTIYNIVSIFNLAMDGNPNIIDILFSPDDCVLLSTEVGEHIAKNKNLFLHKGLYHRFKGYSYQQFRKLKMKNPIEGSKRKDLKEKFGYDVKYALHLVRLIKQIKQILQEESLDIRKNATLLKEIRAGKWKLQDVFDFFEREEKALDELYDSSKLRKYPDKQAIKSVLVDCLEMYYGSLEGCLKK